jgi:hypothetical protein
MSFECALYLQLQGRISSLTFDSLRSLWITVFGTYQGASTVMRKVFDWKCSRISMLEVSGQLQNLATSSPKMSPLLPLDKRLHRRSEHCRKEKISFLVRNFNPDHSVHSSLLY